MQISTFDRKVVSRRLHGLLSSKSPAVSIIINFRTPYVESTKDENQSSAKDYTILLCAGNRT